jgi:hypothetical protein
MNKPAAVALEDFWAVLPLHSYIYTPTGEPWPAASVNARLPPVDTGKRDDEGRPIKIKASLWLDQHRAVEQMTWAPGRPTLIRDQLIREGGFYDWRGVKCLNLYRKPTVELGDPKKAARWLDRGRKVFGDHADHIVKWLAQRVQRPGDKINHALLLGGRQGIGKDSFLEPVKHAVGPWNFSEVSPKHMLGRFNGYLKSVILRVSEARDLGDFDRFAFYDHIKAYTAAPPDVLRVDEKNLREYAVPNCVGVIVTTNHKTDGIHLPADDRRHFVAWSDLSKDDFREDYWTKLWAYYRDGGHSHVASYLETLDISAFDAKAPPPKTQAFWEIVDASRAPEDAEMADAIDHLRSPAALTLMQIIAHADHGFAEWLRDRKNRRQIPHRLEACGYVAVRSDSKDGHWVVHGKRQVIYARADLSIRDRIAAANALAGQDYSGTVIQFPKD